MDYFMESARVRYFGPVVDVLENQKVRVANEWVSWYKNNECVKTVQRTLEEERRCLPYENAAGDTFWPGMVIGENVKNIGRT